MQSLILMAINKKEEFTLIMVFIKTNKNKQLIEQKTYIYIYHIAIIL